MTGIYKDDRFDVVGSMVGIVEKDKVISGKDIKEGDIVIGVASGGLHTNGYVLTRKVLFYGKDQREVMELLNKTHPELGCTLGEELTKPHFPYYSYIHGLLDKGLKIHGMAHVTGGGLPGNIIRILPENMEARIFTRNWQKPPIFSLIQKAGNLNEDLMSESFNLGIGLVFITSPKEAEKVVQFFQSQDVHAYKIGKIQKTEKKGVHFILGIQYSL